MGAVPIRLAYAELPYAMRKGIVTTAMTTLRGWADLSARARVDYVVWSQDRRLFNIGLALVAHKLLMDRIDQKSRDILRKIGLDAEAFYQQQRNAAESEMLATLRKKGVKIIETRDDRFARWRKIAEKQAWPEISKLGDGGAQLLSDLHKWP